MSPLITSSCKQRSDSSVRDLQLKQWTFYSTYVLTYTWNYTCMNAHTYIHMQVVKHAIMYVAFTYIRTYVRTYVTYICTDVSDVGQPSPSSNSVTTLEHLSVLSHRASTDTFNQLNRWLTLSHNSITGGWPPSAASVSLRLFIPEMSSSNGSTRSFWNT